MAKNHGTLGSAVLFTAGISGIALASVGYISLPTASLSLLYGGQCTSLGEMCRMLQGTLFTLGCAFCLGFVGMGLFPLAALTVLRISRLTLDCYLSYAIYGMKHFLWQLAAAGLLGLLFLVFCRLSYLFGLCRKNGRKKLRYTLQFTGDYLFFCGISTIIKLAFHFAAFS